MSFEDHEKKLGVVHFGSQEALPTIACRIIECAATRVRPG